jgi:hypothetical protein
MDDPPIPVLTHRDKRWPLIPIPVRLRPPSSSSENSLMYNRSNSEGSIESLSLPSPDILSANIMGSTSPKRKSDEELIRPSKKKGVKHDRTTVDVYIREAKVVNNFLLTGLADHGKYIVIDEERFYNWVCGNLKDPKYRLVKASLLEKFDKSRRTNRVNPKDKEGPIPIKYLRIDKACRNGLDFSNVPSLEADLEEIERLYGTHNIRVYTHRDWGYLDKKYFVYEPSKKKYLLFSLFHQRISYITNFVSAVV